MKQLYLFLLSIVLLAACGNDEEPTGMGPTPNDEMEVENPDIIETYSLDREECTDLWTSDSSIKYNITQNQVEFDKPINGIGLFSMEKDIKVKLGDDGKFGPTNYEELTTLFVEVYGDTIYIQLDKQGFDTFDSCRSHYVKM